MPRPDRPGWDQGTVAAAGLLEQRGHKGVGVCVAAGGVQHRSCAAVNGVPVDRRGEQRGAADLPDGVHRDDRRQIRKMTQAWNLLERPMRIVLAEFAPLAIGALETLRHAGFDADKFRDDGLDGCRCRRDQGPSASCSARPHSPSSPNVRQGRSLNTPDRWGERTARQERWAATCARWAAVCVGGVSRTLGDNERGRESVRLTAALFAWHLRWSGG